jgi:hypothetical protein
MVSPAILVVKTNVAIPVCCSRVAAERLDAARVESGYQRGAHSVPLASSPCGSTRFG